MRKLISLMTASLVISLAASVYAANAAPDAKSKITSTTVVTKAVPEKLIGNRAQQKRKFERHEFRRAKAKDFVMDFRSEHPRLAHSIITHRDFLKNHGISPVSAMRNPQLFRERLVAHRDPK